MDRFFSSLLNTIVTSVADQPQSPTDCDEVSGNGNIQNIYCVVA
ncbi:hypothetical protein PIIN_00191 [Serendipita indica DSM 11827]|uniref:Pheromone n=1 Tax=Serendipita indica (strain DSM 11827) TaxID=1109443 RepID=G4T578_SERID|nr:hypothetical protein PIIN_00191 [Serendipita indica DSM 11827]